MSDELNDRRLRIGLNVVVLGLAFAGAAAFLIFQTSSSKSEADDSDLGRISLSDDAKLELLTTIDRLRQEHERAKHSELVLSSAEFSDGFTETMVARSASLREEIGVAHEELAQLCARERSRENPPSDPDTEAEGPGVGDGDGTGELAVPLGVPPSVRSVRRRLDELTEVERAAQQRILDLPWPPEDWETASGLLTADFGTNPYGVMDYEAHGYEVSRDPYSYPPSIGGGPIRAARDRLTEAVNAYWNSRYERGSSCEAAARLLIGGLPEVDDGGSKVVPVQRSVARVEDVAKLKSNVVQRLASRLGELNSKIMSRAGLLKDQSFVYERYLPTAIVVMAMLGITLPFFSWVFPEKTRELGFRRGLLRYSTVVLLLVTITVLALGHLIEGEVLATLLSGIGSFVVADQFRDSSARGGGTGPETTNGASPPPASSLGNSTNETPEKPAKPVPPTRAAVVRGELAALDVSDTSSSDQSASDASDDAMGPSDATDSVDGTDPATSKNDSTAEGESLDSDETPRRKQ